jgi:hypothetical protein
MERRFKVRKALERYESTPPIRSPLRATARQCSLSTHHHTIAFHARLAAAGIANMNTADAAGDAFFDMKIPLSIAQCANQSNSSSWPGHHSHGSMCSNPEEFSTDLAISKVHAAIGSPFSALCCAYVNVDVCVCVWWWW